MRIIIIVSRARAFVYYLETEAAGERTRSTMVGGAWW